MLNSCFSSGRFFSILFFFLSSITVLAGNVSRGIINNGQIEFIENKGQVVDTKGNLCPGIFYTGEIQGMKIYFKQSGISYVLMSEDENSIQRIDLDFFGSNPHAEIITGQPLQGYLNYYLGHCPQGITNVKSYNRVTYKNIYPNIDVVFYGGTNNGLKYDIIVNPGGNPDDIKIYAGIL